jgi:predicted nucleotidyltransferase
MSGLSDILGSRVRAELIGLFFGLEDRTLHMREIERRIGFSHRPVQQDLGKLADLQLLVRERSGNRAYFSANREHPLFPEIHRIVLKTSGLADVIKAALSTSNVKTAFIFGSIAEGKENLHSDIDLILIGDVTLREAASLLRPAAEKIGREINPHIFSRKEWHKRADSGEHFVGNLLSSEKLFILGSQNDLKTMG